MVNQVTLDTSPLIIYLVGSFDSNHLSKVKYSNRKFSKIDYDLLIQYIGSKKICITPQILAEMCNIVENSFGKDLFKKFMEHIFSLLKEDIIEIYHRKERLMTNLKIIDFGFSDISLFFCSDINNEVIIGDSPLFYYFKNENKNVKFLDEILAPQWFFTNLPK